jgi:hypothetical protein
MNRSVEIAIAEARARAVPWDAKRAAHVARVIASGRDRSRATITVAGLTFAGLASAVVFASVVRFSHPPRAGTQSEDEGRTAPSAFVPPPEAALDERPLSDGGFEASIE